MNVSTTLRASAMLGLLLATHLASASANDYTPLLKAKKYAEADRLAIAKLATDKGDADALLTRIKVILEQGPASRFEEGSKLAEQCIAAHPQLSECHEALGNTLGAKAMSSGIMSAIGYAGTIRDAFKKAVELDPKNYSARDALLQYYLQAPGIVGGGSDKAQALINETNRLNPELGKLMQGRFYLNDESYTKAEAMVLSANVSSSELLADMQGAILQGLGASYVKEKQYNDADRMFRELQKRYPDDEAGTYGLARVLQERGKTQEAIPLFEKAIAITPRAHIYYRMGQCLQANNDKARAIAAFEKALAFKPELNKKQKSDAEDRLKDLKG